MNPKVRIEGISRQRSGGSLFIHDAQTSKYYELNSTAAQVYEMCDGTRSVAEMAETLKPALAGESEAITFAALAQLDRAGLTETPTAEARAFSRRRFAVAVIAPLVLSVTAHAGPPPTSPLDAGPGPDGGGDGIIKFDPGPGPMDGGGDGGMPPMTMDGGPGPTADLGLPALDGAFDAGGTPPDVGFGAGDGGTP